MRKFKTESQKLLDLMINSIYTNREIFLRELISNASDAIDKLAFMALTDPNVQLGPDELAIRLSFDKDARTITVSDNGIGMTEEELDRNLGTIAHSGSEAFKEANAEHQGEDIDIINLLEVNTTPGLTPTSFIPQQAAYAKIEMRDMLSDIIAVKLS